MMMAAFVGVEYNYLGHTTNFFGDEVDSWAVDALYPR